MGALVEQGHILSGDTEMLEGLCTLPVSYQGFVAKLLLKYSSGKSTEVDATLRSLFANVRDIVELLEFWEAHSFGRKETGQLLRLLEQLCAENAAVVASMQEWKDRVVGEHGEEDLATLFWDKLEEEGEGGSGVGASSGGSSGSSHAVLTAYDYQRIHRREIDKYLHSIAVKEVYYPQYEPVTNLGASPLGRETLAYDLNKDFEVRTLTIRLPVKRADLLRVHCNRIEALRQLAFSPHFVDTRGANEDGTAVAPPGSDPLGPSGAIQYFFEHVPQVTKITSLINKYGTLAETTYVMRYWCRSLLVAFSDLLSKCTLRIRDLPSVHNVVVAESGLRLLVRNLTFLSDRPQGAAAHAELEEGLVRAFGRIVFFMLTATDPDASDEDQVMPSIPLEPFLRGILRCCLYTTRRPSLADLLSHPFFADATSFTDDDISSEFQALVRPR